MVETTWTKLSKEEREKRVEEVRVIKHKTHIRKYEYEEESFGPSVEPKYFWLIDFLKKMKFKIEKHEESIGASVISQFFGEMSQRRQFLEKRGMEILGTINTVVRSIINLLYDLREFDRRLKIYDDLDLNDSEIKDAADKALKRVWMDEVDVRKGNGSINAMAATRGLEFTTLRDAFIIVDDVKDIAKLDLNRRVKDVIKQRIVEYLKWRDESAKELRQRRRIELAYLKSQIRSLQLYSNWAKPYLQAAQRLQFEDVDVKDPQLIQAFDQNFIKIVVRATKDVGLRTLFKKGTLPRSYSPPDTWSKKKQEEAKAEKEGPRVKAIIELKFTYRTKPFRETQTQAGGVYRQLGKLNVEFNGYLMEIHEYEMLERQEEYEAMKFIEGLTSESLEPMREEIERYIEEEITEGKKEEQKKKKGPLFDKLLGGFSFGGGASKDSDKPTKGIFGGFQGAFINPKIKIVKQAAREDLADRLFTLYDVFKKAHKLLAFPYFPSYKTPPASK